MLGENLSTYRNVQTFESLTAQGIDNIQNSIRVPYRILARYGVGKKHFLTISTTKKIKVKVRKFKLINTKQEIENVKI